MERSEIQVGRLYAIAGQGPMRVEALHDTSIECRTPLGGRYWAGYDQVVREVDDAYVAHYVEEMRRRVSPDYAATWGDDDA